MSNPHNKPVLHKLSTFLAQGEYPCQEDHILVDRDRGIFVVADGFGGPSSGHQAAKLSCESK